MAMKIEEYMGFPDKFDMLPQEFEDMIMNNFEIEETDKAIGEREAMGVIYCLRCKK